MYEGSDSMRYSCLAILRAGGPIEIDTGVPHELHVGTWGPDDDEGRPNTDCRLCITTGPTLWGSLDKHKLRVLALGFAQ